MSLDWPVVLLIVVVGQSASIIHHLDPDMVFEGK